MGGKVINDWITDSFSSRNLRILLKALTDGDLKLFERIFSNFVRDTLSFYDTGKRCGECISRLFIRIVVNLNDYEIISNPRGQDMEGWIFIFTFH